MTASPQCFCTNTSYFWILFLTVMDCGSRFKVWGSIHFRIWVFYVKKTHWNLVFHFPNDWSRFSQIGENFPGLLFNFLNFKNTFVFEFSIFSFVFRSGQIRTCPDLSGFVRILSEKLEKKLNKCSKKKIRFFLISNVKK